MAAQQQTSVLQRKTRAAREGSDSRVMSPAKALRLSLARAADTLLGLALSVATIEQRRIEAAEVEGELGSGGLFILLDGANGARGALWVDPALMAGVIEVQTIGQVLPGPVRPRTATRTDAAMVAPLADAMLAGLDAEMGSAQAGYVPREFRFGDRVEDGRALALLLSEPELDLFRLTVDLDHGARTGRLDLLLPPAPVGPPGTRRARTSSQHAPDMAAVALGAAVVLDVALARITLPLRAAMSLKPGDRLYLPRDNLAAAQLLGAGGHVAAHGRLGQREGWRALRLSGPVQKDAAPSGPATTDQATPEPARIPAIASSAD